MFYHTQLKQVCQETFHTRKKAIQCAINTAVDAHPLNVSLKDGQGKESLEITEYGYSVQIV